jgi:hypothetical protein
MVCVSRLAGLGAVRLYPPADQASRLVKRACRMLVAPPVQQSEISGESKQDAQLLNPQVCPAQMLGAIPGVDSLYQRYEHIQGEGLDAVADGEFLAPGEFPRSA